MISKKLARKLRDAGLEWVPAEGDRFVIPDRDLEEFTFLVSEMVVEVRRIAQKRRIMFNGAVEWALDSIVQSEAMWLPSEAQLRNRLGRAFDTLTRSDNGFTCTTVLEGERREYEAADPADAYALALLDVLADPDAMMRLMINDPAPDEN